MTHTTSSAPRNRMAELWDQVADSPIKRGALSAFYWFKAPYFHTVMPRI